MITAGPPLTLPTERNLIVRLKRWSSATAYGGHVRAGHRTAIAIKHSACVLPEDQPMLG